MGESAFERQLLSLIIRANLAHIFQRGNGELKGLFGALNHWWPSRVVTTGRKLLEHGPMASSRASQGSIVRFEGYENKMFVGEDIAEQANKRRSQ